MPVQFFTNYIELLKDDEYHDITIEVGNNNVLTRIKLPNVLPEIFQTILEYIYGDSLVSLIKRDDLQMKEIEVWEQVVKWGLAQNPTLTLDPKTCVFNINILRPRKIKIKEIKIDDSQIIDSKIDDSQIIDSKINDSQIIDSKIVDSKTDDSQIIDSKIVDSQIIDSKIVDSNMSLIVLKWIDKVVGIALLFTI
ncbi:unnamed protein product [Rhizophagus irregularis]|nr:unnamed protein product [Rhizophagus irregularis]